jgi:hypothetical protein
MKVDIACAFDSVTRPFLMEILAHLGFPSDWINWVSILLAISSTKVLMNGTLGDTVCHVCDMHQGNLFSPMLFLLVIEVMAALIGQTNVWSLTSGILLRR